MPSEAEQHEALTTGVGFAELRDWTQIELAGVDRLKFLNNFCTADLRRLTPGSIAEAFLCNVKGKVLGHVWISCDTNVLVIETVPGQAGVLLPHLERYTLSDDVTLRDITGEFTILFVGGPQAAKCLQTLTGAALPATPMTFVECHLDGHPCRIAHGTMLGRDAFSLCLSPDDLPNIAAQLRNAGAVECDASALEAFRIERVMPFYGRDITLENLPQEVNRNAQAISFTKGCYLGQETVARIDALGHVNRLLVGLRFDGEQVPGNGAELTVDGKAVGQVTSAAYSTRLAKAVALAYVRTVSAIAGTRLQSPVGEAEVVG